MKALFAGIALISAVLFFTIFSCKKANVPKCDGTNSSYNSNMKTIINANCTSSACHPTYITYTGIKGVLDNGSFKSRVISQKDMPKGSSLSADNLNKIQCWIDAGYPQ